MQTDTSTAPSTRPSAERAARTGIADCDLHPVPKSMQKEIYPFLARRWQENLETFGASLRIGFQGGSPYVKGQPDAARMDAWPAGGGRPGSRRAE